MLEQDYLMRMFLQLAELIRRSWLTARQHDDPRGAADTLEDAISEATDIDGATLLSLTPESMAGILQVSGTDPRVIGYIVQSLDLESVYLREAGDDQLAGLRFEQACALAESYGLDMPEDPEDFSNLPGDVVLPDGSEPAMVDIEDTRDRRQAKTVVVDPEDLRE